VDILREDLFGWYICKKARHHLVLGIYDIIPTMYPSITSKVNKHLSKSFIKYFLYRTDCLISFVKYKKKYVWYVNSDIFYIEYRFF